MCCLLRTTQLPHKLYNDQPEMWRRNTITPPPPLFTLAMAFSTMHSVRVAGNEAINVIIAATVEPTFTGQGS